MIRLLSLFYYRVVKVLMHPRFLVQFFKFRKLQDKQKGRIKYRDIFPFFNDDTPHTGFDTHYIYHSAWAARTVKAINPPKHVDISSTLYFCTQLSAFIPTEFYDYRPAKLNLSNLQSERVDLCAMHFQNESINSLSCMHTIEHVGLGRYGDALDPSGDLKAAKELQRVLAKGGDLLLVTPVGQPRIMFNGHRIYSFEQITGMFDQLKLHEFSLIPDKAAETGIMNNADPKLVGQQKYGCGCFWFKKEN